MTGEGKEKLVVKKVAALSRWRGSRREVLQLRRSKLAGPNR